MTMNPTLDVIMNRKSVRAYEDRPVSAEAKDAILNAALRAPTAGNMMLYTVIEVEDQPIKDRLVKTCDNQPFIAKAPYVLLFLADYQRWYDYYLASGVQAVAELYDREVRRPQEGDLLLACCDTLIAAHTAVIAAESLGIGSCYIGDILENYEIHRELFDLPQYVLPLSLICFGYPTRGQMERKQTERFDREFIVHQNSYRRLDESSLERMMKSRNELLHTRFNPPQGVNNVGQMTFLRKFTADFSLEMSRSVRAMIESWTFSE